MEVEAVTCAGRGRGRDGAGAGAGADDGFEILEDGVAIVTSNCSPLVIGIEESV